VSLSDVEIAAVVAELAPRLAGQTVGKVDVEHDHTAVLELGRDRLVLSAHPRASRVQLAPPRAGARRETPAAFAMLLRKRFSGLRLHELRVAAAGERVVELDFGAGRDRLVAELTGPHANVFVVDAAGLIVSSLRPSHSTTRPLAPGATYAPPPPGPADARWRGTNRFGAAPGVAERVAEHYAAQLAREEEQRLRDRLAAALRRAVDRLARRERALEGDLRRAAEAAAYKKLGDLLLAHLWEVPGRGATTVTVADDFEDGAPLTIALDPTLDAKQNAARYYKQHKRLSGGQKRIAERLAATRERRAELETRLLALPGLPLERLRVLEQAMPPEARRAGGGEGAPGRARRGDEAPARLPYREFRSLAGDVILVGRGAADNDTLTFRVARGNDLWLHTRDAPGAHVIVRRGKSAELSPATLVDAATLAAHHSPLSGEAQVDVSYTAAKNVRKPRGAAPGLVYVSDAKTILVRLEPERLARLLGERDGGD
jgi:predicted ribosome quality control (RQC) complex YloA/Tae2 family protein